MGWVGNKVVRNNTRNTGATIWDEDAVASQAIDSIGHDFHDEDLAQSITATLNISGANQMLADLNVGNFKMVALAPGTNDTDGVNYAQLSSVQTQVTSLDGRVTVIETADPFVAQSLQIAGEVNQLSQFGYGTSGAITILSLSANRHTLTNNGAITLTIQEPVGTRAIGDDYCVEGTVLVTNTASAGIITIVGASADEVLGSNPTLNGSKYLLTYLIHVQGGAVAEKIYVWSAVG